LRIWPHGTVSESLPGCDEPPCADKRLAQRLWGLRSEARVRNTQGKYDHHDERALHVHSWRVCAHNVLRFCGGRPRPPRPLKKSTPVAAEAFGPAGSKRLLEGAPCHTLHDMKTAALTIRLDTTLERQLARAARRTGRSRSELVRDALRRQLALAQFDDLRQRIMPLAEARGYLTDEDIFRDVS
jgi:predicted transcriptional regulator